MNPYAEPLAWALVNFVWQGAALALAAFLVIRWIRPSAGARYATGVVTLALMLASPILTFAILARNAGATPEPPASASQTAEPRTFGPPDATSTPADASASQTAQFPASALVLAVWLSGVAVFSLRLLGGWVVARRMVTRAVRPVAPEVAVLARRVAARLALDRVVRIVESSAVSVPVMVGWLKPVVLLPAVALSGLAPTQLEALLAHELAHVRRHDYLVNLLQSAVETLLFYHPAVWWVSKQVRAEREHCCDDMVVGVCDRVIYVSALTDLAAMSVPRTALAATDGSLLTRVRRLLGGTDAGVTTGAGWISVFVAMFVVGAIAPMTTATARTAVPDPNTANIALVGEQGVGGGVAAGVTGGGPGGVTAGVPSGVGFIEEQASTDAEQARQREFEIAAARLQALQTELNNLAQERSSLDLMKLQEALKRQRGEAEAELKAFRQEHERTKRMVDQGLLSRDHLAAMEARMQQAERKMEGQQRELDLTLFERALGQGESDARKMVEMRIAELEMARLTTEAQARGTAQDSRAAADARARLAQIEREIRELRLEIERRRDVERPVEREMQELRGIVERRRAQAEAAPAIAERQRSEAEAARAIAERQRSEIGRAREEVMRDVAASAQSRDARLLARSTPLAGANERIRAGDVLSVDIKGETELPRAYAVQNDGTIRLPLIGSIKVAGLTSQQAGQAITRQIARVNSSASVHVSLRRGGSDERRER